jgi:formate dehydrogenase iron-sulfur subunit
MAFPLIMLIDMSKCIGCKACQIACQQWNSLPAEDTAFTGSYQNPADLSGANLTITQFTEYQKTQYAFQWLFFIHRCRHCADPFCLGACPLGAITQNAWGMVLIDEALCDPFTCLVGDPAGTLPRPCQIACPFGVPKFKFQKGGTQFADIDGDVTMKKCTFCFDRLPIEGDTGLPVGAFANTQRPACQVACPTGAISVGAVGPKMAEANARVAALQSHGWLGAGVYGGTAGTGPAGLTHVCWVLTEPRAVYGL